MKKLMKALLASSLVLCMWACSNKSTDFSLWFAGNGNVAGELKSIEIDWVDGSVEVKYGKSDEITINEKPSGNLTDEQKVHWILDGTTLKVQYSAEKKVDLDRNFQKDLVIEIPESVNLDSLKIDGASAEIESIVNAKDIEVNTASGNVDIDVDKSSSVKVNSASGDMSISMKEFTSANIGSASGNVTVLVPKTSNFTASVDTVSGKVNSELKMEKDGNTYKNGTGDSKIQIETVSGNVDFQNHKEKVRDLVYK